MESKGGDFAVRLVNQNDCARIWEIKNHPIVRANSNNQEEVVFASHKPWFDKTYFSGADNHCYILESKVGEVIGYCRFDYKAEEGAYIISIALDPEYHGRGLGSILLKESLSQFNYGHGKKILAEIKKDNAPSIKLFKKNNFEIYGEDDANYQLSLSRQQASLSAKQYQALYNESLQEPDKFWGTIASAEIEWFSKWNKVLDWQSPHCQWFVGGKLNITHNCLDRHAHGERQDKIAFIHVDEKGTETSVTYKELSEQVNKFANALRGLGVTKGDRVVIYMPLVIEQVVAMLACARIGAIHSVVFAGLSDKALQQRIIDSGAKIVVTANWTLRRGKKIDLKSVVEEAIVDLNFVEKVVVLQREKDYYQLTEKEVDFYELLSTQPEQCKPEVMDSEDPLFILYTSGSTGQPKGVLHTIGGYSVFTHYTTKTVFDLKEDDIFWCTADPGWITGHSYVVYGPLSVGATVLLVEGAPDYPAPDRWWEIIEKYKVSIFYTSPTAIRLLRKYGEKYIAPRQLGSLRILGSVGEPISPEVWKWFYTFVGHNHCALIDTWWQTETGGHMIVTLPSLPQKPGKAGLPFFGIEADIVDKQGNSLPIGEKGFLVIRKPWPTALRTCWNDEERFVNYWNEIPGVYFTGDFAIKDEDGYIQIIGRADDVLNVSGHRIGTAEAESALASHPVVAEAAVIGKPHEIKGQALKAFIVLKPGIEPSDQLQDDIKLHVRHELGGYAVPDEVEFVLKLPKTRSGKIMRRILRAQEGGEEVGDLTTLED